MPPQTTRSPMRRLIRFFTGKPSKPTLPPAPAQDCTSPPRNASLPPEILHCIFQYFVIPVDFDHYDYLCTTATNSTINHTRMIRSRGQYPPLLSVIRVCKNWSIVGVTLLYSQVILFTTSQISNFRKTAQLHHSLRVVKCLYFYQGKSYGWSPPRVNSCKADIAFIIDHCPSVKFLHHFSRNADTFPGPGSEQSNQTGRLSVLTHLTIELRSTLGCFEKLTLPQLRFLCLHNFFISNTTTLPSCPSLKILRLTYMVVNASLRLSEVTSKSIQVVECYYSTISVNLFCTRPNVRKSDDFPSLDCLRYRGTSYLPEVTRRLLPVLRNLQTLSLYLPTSHTDQSTPFHQDWFIFPTVRHLEVFMTIQEDSHLDEYGYGALNVLFRSLESLGERGLVCRPELKRVVYHVHHTVPRDDAKVRKALKLIKLTPNLGPGGFKITTNVTMVRE